MNLADLVLFCQTVEPYGDLSPETRRKLMLLDQAGGLLYRLRAFSSSPVRCGSGFRYLRTLGVINKAHKRYMRRLRAIN